MLVCLVKTGHVERVVFPFLCPVETEPCKCAITKISYMHVHNVLHIIGIHFSLTWKLVELFPIPLLFIYCMA